MIPSIYDQTIRNGVIEFMPNTIDWRIIKAQFWQESRFKSDAVSPVGASGIAQIMPATWSQWTVNKQADIFDPTASIMTGCRYMAYLHGQWSSPRPQMDRICLALASYNAGLGNILSAQEKAQGAFGYSQIIAKLPDVTGKHSKETIDYVRKIMKFYIDQVTG